MQGEVLATERTTEGDAQVDNVRVDVGGDELTAEHQTPPGVDALPLPGDIAALVDSPGAGNKQAVGYTDPKNEGKAKPGEHRLYLRDEAGALLAEFFFKREGLEITGIKAGFPITIKTSGPVVVDSPDVTLGGTGGRKVACLGDVVTGTISALSASSGQPCTPDPLGAVPIPFAGQIVSACANVDAF